MRRPWYRRGFFGRGGRRLALACALLAVLLSLPLSADEALPRPPGLEDAIQFWIRVYTEVDTDSGFLHDPYEMSVIYGRAPDDREERDKRRERIQADLRVLATGKRSGLSRRQRRLLALWPEDVSDATLQAAADRIRWQRGQSDRFRDGLQRSGAYRDHIQRVIEEKGLPPELAVLPHVESSFTPYARSSAAAAGMWQFGRSTGRRFMRIDHIVDIRMDPYLTTEHAMSLLEFNYNVLGTWPLALTAYNHGANGIARAKARVGSDDIAVIVADYRGRAFGFASRNFYAQFLAALEVDRNHREYFGNIRFDPPPDFVEVKTDAFIGAGDFARSLEVSLEQLRADNPALRPPVWNGDKRIPAGFTLKLRAEDVSGTELLAMIPGHFKFAVQIPDVEYRVQRGDALSVIAGRFDTTVRELMVINNLRNANFIRAGQVLVLPQNEAAHRHLAAAEGGFIYTVRSGDNISRIAARYGVSREALLSVNNIRDPRIIHPGDRINIPGPELEALDSQAPALAAAPPETEATGTLAAASSVSPEDGSGELPRLFASLSDVQQPSSSTEPGEPSMEEANAQLAELLASDPSDYSVGEDGSVEIHASETLGHYADWLGIRAWDLRRLNGMDYRDPVIIGERLTLDFSRVGVPEFELQRRRFHSTLQQEFFSSYRIRSTEQYRVKSGDNIGTIARERYSTPIWLLRQYNPGLEINHIQPGQQITLPLLEPVQ